MLIYAASFFSKPIVRSLLIHALLVLIFLYLNFKRESSELTSRPIPDEVEVTFATKSKGKSGDGAPSKAPIDFSISHEPGEFQDNKSSQGSGPPGAYQDEENAGYETANTMDMKTEGKLHPFFSAIYSRIDHTLQYPQDFVDHRVSGKIHVQFEVDKTGVFTGKIFKVESTDPLIKTLVLASIIHALREPIQKERWSQNEKTAIAAEFEFKLVPLGGDAKRPEIQRFKNVMVFYRLAHIDYADEARKFIVKYFPPVIPIPGGFYIDFITAYHQLRGIGKRDEKIQRYERMQLKREEWENIIKKEAK